MTGFARLLLIGLFGFILVSSIGIMLVSASHSDSPYDHIDESTTLSYNESELKHYQPKLATHHLDVEPSAVYAYKAQSTNSALVVYAYWVKYPLQAGGTSLDSHMGDREPIYVFVDPADGDVEKVSFSRYHYLKGTVSADEVAIENGSPVLRVSNPYHHYEPLEDDEANQHYKSQDTLKPFIDENEMDSEVQYWKSNGWTEVNYDVVMNPHEIQDEESWWENERAWHYKASENFWEVYRPIDNLLDSVPVLSDLV